MCMTLNKIDDYRFYSTTCIGDCVSYTSSHYVHSHFLCMHCRERKSATSSTVSVTSTMQFLYVQKGIGRATISTVVYCLIYQGEPSWTYVLQVLEVPCDNVVVFPNDLNRTGSDVSSVSRKKRDHHRFVDIFIEAKTLRCLVIKCEPITMVDCTCHGRYLKESSFS
jgi:hypothetical protein